MSANNSCPTCRSPNKDGRRLNSDRDADVPIRGRITTRSEVLQESNINGKTWYSGWCPDAWHDVERRSGKDRRRSTKRTDGPKTGKRQPADFEAELDNIIAREKPGYKRVRIVDPDASSTDTADLIRKYLGKKANSAARSKNTSDLTIVHVRPEHESDDPRQNVSKALVISRSKKKIIGEQG